MRHHVVLLVCASLCISFSVDAQHVKAPSSQFVLNFDYARFQYDSKSAYVECYYAFYPRLVTYIVRDTQFWGGVSVHTIIRNKTTGDTLLNSRSFLPLQIRDTSEASFKYTNMSQTGYMVPFGDYTLSVVASDSLSPDRRDSLSLPLPVNDFPSRESCSDIELCADLKNSTNKSDPFFKNSLEVIPNATLVYGIVSYPVLFYYVEFYNLDTARTYSIKAQVLSSDGKVLRETTKLRKYGFKNSVEVGNMNMTSIPSGKCRLRLVLGDTLLTEIARTEKVFFTYNPHIKQAQTALSSIKASELAGMTAEELAEEFRRAQYAATKQQIEIFAKITSLEGRREFLAQFWLQVEKGELGKPPISRTEYLRRVLEAIQKFGALSHEGWRTDRGRVYIVYGPPDEVERVPSSQDSKPYEKWHYYSIESGVEFDFIDRTGFGDYILVNSTKRGELRDDSWQRLLQ